MYELIGSRIKTCDLKTLYDIERNKEIMITNICGKVSN